MRRIRTAAIRIEVVERSRKAATRKAAEKGEGQGEEVDGCLQARENLLVQICFQRASVPRVHKAGQRHRGPPDGSRPPRPLQKVKSACGKRRQRPHLRISARSESLPMQKVVEN